MSITKWPLVCLKHRKQTNLNPFQIKKKSFKWGFRFLFLQGSSNEHRILEDLCFILFLLLFPRLVIHRHDLPPEFVLFKPLCCLLLRTNN